MSDRVLSEIREELESIQHSARAALERLARLGAGFGPASAVPPVPSGVSPVSVRQVLDVLPHDLHPKLTVLDQGDGLVTVKSVWLPRPDWLRLDELVKSMGGRWIPDGKNSRWEVPVPGSRA